MSVIEDRTAAPDPVAQHKDTHADLNLSRAVHDSVVPIMDPY